MFHHNDSIIEAFVAQCLERYRRTCPDAGQGRLDLLERAATNALLTLLRCDCPYHDAEHTMLVVDAGQNILRGRQISQGDVSAQDWLDAVVAMLYHDIGYLRSLLREDNAESCLANESGSRVTPPPGSTDAFMMPYHVSRSCMFVHEQFADEPLLDIATVAGHIEMTRFPVPAEPAYQKVDSFAGLVRAADLIGQMGDPQYSHKLTRLYAEFVETGEAQRLGYRNPAELREGFPDFFYEKVYPYISEGLRYLRKTEEGQQWIDNLFRHVHDLRDPDELPEELPENVTPLTPAAGSKRC